MNIPFISLAVLFCFSLGAEEQQSKELKQEYMIVDFDKSAHADAVMKISFQDPYSLCIGGSWLNKHYIIKFFVGYFFIKANKEEIQKLIDNDKVVKRVLIVDQEPVGFLMFYKTREQSLESMKRLATERNVQFNEEAILKAIPNLKKTDAECVYFIEIEAIAVHKDFRAKGFGRALMEDTLTKIKTMWPEIAHARLNVNEDNERAQKLYIAQGFEIDPQQPPHLQIMNALQFRKKLQ